MILIPCYFIFNFQKISFKRFNGGIGRLHHDDKFTYQTCPGQGAQRAEKYQGMELNGQTFEVKDKPFYPGDTFGTKGNALNSAKITKEWNKFRKLLPFLTCRGLPLEAKWILYFAYLPSGIP